MVGRFVLADPSLLDFGGHCYEYLASLQAELDRRGIATAWLGNRAMKPHIAAASDALRVFTHGCDIHPPTRDFASTARPGLRFPRCSPERQLIADLQEADARLRFAPTDVLFINTLRHWAIRSVIDWAAGLARDRVPHIALVLHFTAYPSPFDDHPSAAVYEAAFRRLENSAVRDRFTLFSDSDDLIDEYRGMTRLDMHLVPIPHTNRGACQSARLKADDRIIIAYVGEARENKGYHLLPHLIDGIQRNGLARSAHFHVQSFVHDPENAVYQRAMGRMGRRNVTLFPDQLDTVAYQTYLASADVILVPYLLDNYYKQTSGIFAEAISMSKPTIVPRGSWMARQVKQFGGGRVFIPDDPQDLLDTTSDLIRTYPAVAAQAQVAGRDWNVFHSSQNFIDIVMACIGRGAA